MAIVARVTDYMALRNGFLTDEERKNLKKEKAGYEVATINGKEAHLIHRGSYVILASDKEVAERYLGHVIGGVRGIYDRHEFHTEKARCAESLASLVARIISGQGANVVSLRG